MLVDIDLSPNAIEEMSARRVPGGAKSARQRLFRILSAHGSIVFSNGLEVRAFNELLGSTTRLTVEEQKLWREFMIHMQRENRVGKFRPEAVLGLHQVVTMSDLNQQLSTRSSDVIAVLPRELYQSLFPEDDVEIAGLTSNVTIATPDSLPGTDLISKAVALVERGNFPEGTRREDIWEQVFFPLARRSRNITILDRYIFRRMEEAQALRRPAQHPDHLQWLLQKIHSHALPGTVVRVLTEMGTGRAAGTAEGAVQLLQNAWQPGTGSIREIVCAGTVWERGGGMPHNRHIRFGPSTALSCVEGVDRLCRPSVYGSDGFTWVYKWNAEGVNPMITNENRVLNDASAQSSTLNLS